MVGCQCTHYAAKSVLQKVHLFLDIFRSSESDFGRFGLFPDRFQIVFGCFQGFQLFWTVSGSVSNHGVAFFFVSQISKFNSLAN